MKSGSSEVYCGAMPQAVDDMWMAYAIEGDGLVLKVCDKRAFQFQIRSVLQKHVQRLDHDRCRSAVLSSVVVSNVNLRIASATQTFKNVVTPVEPALL